MISSANASRLGLEAFGGPADLDKYILVLETLRKRVRVQSADEYILVNQIYRQIASLCLRKWHLTNDKEDSARAEQALFKQEAHARAMMALAVYESDQFESQESGDEDTNCIDKAVRMGHEAITVLNKDTSTLNDFSTILLTRYEALEKPEDLQSAADFAKQALEICDVNDPSTAIYQASYANCLKMSYESSNDPQALSEAIQLLVAAKETASLHPGLPTAKIFSNLAELLHLRYEALGTGPDLFDAIHFSLAALELSEKDDDGSYPVILGNLAAFLQSYSQTEPTAENLDNAIVTARAAVEALEDSPLQRNRCLYNLASMLEDKARSLSDEPDQERITYLDEAVSLLEEPGQLGHVDKSFLAMATNLLSRLIGLRYELSAGKKNDELDKAISKSRAAIDLCDNFLGPAQKGNYLVQLGDMLQLKYIKDESDESFKAALSAFSECAKLEHTESHMRTCALHRAALLCIKRERWDEAASFAQKAVDMLPNLALQAIEGDSQQRVLDGLSGISGFAAALVLKTGRPAGKAFELLEAGRGITSMRITGFNRAYDLDKDGQTLLQIYKELRQRIQAPLTSGWPEVGYPGPLTNKVSSLVKDTERAKQLQEKLQTQYGIDLDQRLSEKEIIDAASNAPIVAFVVNDVQSFALIATNLGIEKLLLPDLNIRNCAEIYAILQMPLRDAVRNLTFETFYEVNENVKSALIWLWKMAVKPVLQRLEFFSAEQSRIPLSPTEELPRIHWVTSGILGMMPLHAAGYHDAASTENTLSYVVSSYTTAVYSLRQSIRSAETSPFIRQDETGSPLKAVVLGMSKTPEPWTDFDTVADHVAAIEQLIPNERDRTYIEQPTSTAALQALGAAPIAHLVCHAISQPRPSNSSFIFCRPRKPTTDTKSGDSNTSLPSEMIVDPLTVRRLAHQTSTSAPSHTLAFLAACQTADTGTAPGLVDENIHLAGALQLLGYANVVGTLWEVEQTASATFARAFYAALGRRIGTGIDVVARAAHDAMVELRGEAPEDVVIWAPVVCFGA